MRGTELVELLPEDPGRGPQARGRGCRDPQHDPGTGESHQGHAAWCTGTRARVGARAALEQAEELRHVLDELGGQVGE